MSESSTRKRSRLDTIVNLRMNAEEVEKLEALRERLQRDAPAGYLTTRRGVIMEALELLAAKYAKLDADRERKR